MYYIGFCMKINKKVLYITYDGMTDPLGQSQVLPYLCGLAKEGYQFTILSFEKKERYERFKDVITGITEGAGITWVPLSFTTKPPILSKFYDSVRMKRTAFRLHRLQQFDMIHCRSYIAADLGLKLKRKTGVNFLFDMRGFWADEKKTPEHGIRNGSFFVKYINTTKKRKKNLYRKQITLFH